MRKLRTLRGGAGYVKGCGAARENRSCATMNAGTPISVEQWRARVGSNNAGQSPVLKQHLIKTAFQWPSKFYTGIAHDLVKWHFCRSCDYWYKPTLRWALL